MCSLQPRLRHNQFKVPFRPENYNIESSHKHSVYPKCKLSNLLKILRYMTFAVQLCNTDNCNIFSACHEFSSSLMLNTDCWCSMTKYLLHVPLSLSVCPVPRLHRSVDRSLSHSISADITKNSFHQWSKVPGINRMSTAFSLTQWIPQIHQSPIMTKSLNPWLWLMFGLHCWYCPLLLLSPFKSTHLTKWKQQQKHKQKPPLS